jgi:hypothetical protein
MVQWDSNGLKGVLGRYEVTVYPIWEGWTTVIWIGKTHIATLSLSLSKADAQVSAEHYITYLAKATDRLLDRIKYDDEQPQEDEE